MNTKLNPGQSRGFKLTAAVVGAGAAIALASLAIGLDRNGSDAVMLAGSGDAPTNTIYLQPTVKGMNQGATAVMTTTPPSAPAIAVASPAVKAGG